MFTDFQFENVTNITYVWQDPRRSRQESWGDESMRISFFRIRHIVERGGQVERSIGRALVRMRRVQRVPDSKHIVGRQILFGRE